MKIIGMTQRIEILQFLHCNPLSSRGEYSLFMMPASREISDEPYFFTIT